ncbi:inorganic phosphate transporter [Acidianus sulfidivorans JP7]|uniref:Anion permease n=1 Tax=Acidianus sulfidivorans JP7 TaxID=619593 RepID=A0A2U9IKA4_9CREN|nr:inorganic phosphate transporter [Acidianus sulfidivorans]AWR96406.1 inorganic phosphate transporter [Acidianus sulfidivorans JP7]
MVEFLSILIFVLGLISSFVVGGNNTATALGILLSTNALKRKYSYLISALSLFLGTTIGSITMKSSITGIVKGEQQILEAVLFSVLFASIVSFYYLNKAGIPSSLSQMIYPSLAILILVSHGLLFNWGKFWFTVSSWIFSPILAIFSSLILYFILKKILSKQKLLFKQLQMYRELIIISSIFTSFVTGANAIGIIVSAGLQYQQFYVVAPLYGLAAALGVYLSSKKASIVVGFKVTRLGYTSAVSALVGSDIISEIFTILGVPISITQTSMGGVIGLSFRSFGYDVKKQLTQVTKGWLTSPFIAIIASLAAYGIIKSILGL